MLREGTEADLQCLIAMQNQTNSRSFWQRVAIVLAVSYQIGATFLPSLGLGDPIGQRSDAIRTLVVPAGWAFAIWGPLFLGCAIYAVWQVLPAQKNNLLLDRIGWYTAGAAAANGAWATYTQFYNLTAISALIILISLVCLLATLRELVDWKLRFTQAEQWIVVPLFSALAAWLTVASTVNITAALTYHGVGGGLRYSMLAAAVIVVAGLIASTAIYRSRGNPWYCAVILWAMLAIFYKGGQQFGEIAFASAIAAVLVVWATLARLTDADNRRHWLRF